MFVGHFAIGLASKRAAPHTSMGTLVLAAILADVLVWILVVLGVEHVAIKPGITATNALDLYDYPISHSLLMDVVWGALMAGVYFGVRKYPRGALLIFAAVLSHWTLDWISHRPDMPLAPGLHVYLGLGLYNSRIGMLLVEGSLWLAGIVIYARATHSPKRIGVWTLYVGVAILTLLWVASLNGAPPRVSVVTMGKIDLVFLALLIAWAYWVDGSRELKVAQPRLGSPSAQS